MYPSVLQSRLVRTCLQACLLVAKLADRNHRCVWRSIFAPVGSMCDSVHKRSTVSCTKLSWAVKSCHCRLRDGHYHSELIRCQQRHVPGEKENNSPPPSEFLDLFSLVRLIVSIELAIRCRFNQLKLHCCKLLLDWKYWIISVMDKMNGMQVFC